MASDDLADRGRRRFCEACIGGMTVATVGFVAYPIVTFMGFPKQLKVDKPVELPLDRLEVGQVHYVEFRGKLLIVLSAEEGPRVFDASCPHLGCNVAWDAAAAVFRCPCHGAIFDDGGGVVSGPVSTGLAEVDFEIKDGMIVIS